MIVDEPIVPAPRVALGSFTLLDALIQLPRAPNSSAAVVPLVDKRICRKILDDRDAMAEVLTFVICRAADPPRTDLQWVASRGVDVFKRLITHIDLQKEPLKFLTFRSNVGPEGVDVEK